MSSLIRNIVSTVLLLAISAVSQAEVTVTYLHSDAAGSVVAASDESGDLVWRKGYLPYGGKRQDGQPENKAVGYTGHTHDDDTGLIYMKARSYDPDLQRFIQMDPASVLGHSESNPMMFNRYAYANNNPYKYVDLDGRNPEIKARRNRALAKALVPKNSKVRKILDRADLTDEAWRATLRGDRKAAERAVRELKRSLNKGLRPEAKYLKGKKHGLKWDEGPATAKKTGVPQGQWGSRADLEFAGKKASTLKPGEGKWFKLPKGHSSVVHRPDGTTAPASRIWVRNNGSGTFHGYPAE